MKRALLPLLVLLGVVVLLVAAAYVYERRWGIEGPFPNHHHHDGGVDQDESHDHAAETAHP